MKPSLLIFAITTLIANTAAEAITISDGDFDSWSFAGTGTVSVSHEASGGEPGSRINITTVSGPTVYGTAIKQDYSTTEQLSGVSFNMTLDVLSGPGSRGQGQRILLLVEQNAAIYGYNTGITGYPRNWDMYSVSGTFDTSNFALLLGTGPNHPNFDGGVTTYFGFAGGNSISGTLTQYYDNFTLQSFLQQVPEPPSALLFIGGILLLAGYRSLDTTT